MEIARKIREIQSQTAEMVHIKAYKGSEIRRFEIDPASTFAQLKELVVKLFSLGEDDTVIINYCDRDGDVIRLSSDGELQTAVRHLGEEDTWKLQVVVQHKEPPQHAAPPRAAASWWDWDPFHLHGGHHLSHHHPSSHHHMPHHVPHRGGLFDSLFGHSLLGHSLLDDDPFGFGQFDLLRQQHQRLQSEQQKRAEMARRHAMRQASVDAKRAADEVQVQAQASGGEVTEKKPKVVYRHFGSWEPKVEKGDNYVVTTYGPVGYEVNYTHDEQEGTKAEDQEGTKTEDQQPPETKQEEEEPAKME